MRYLIGFFLFCGVAFSQITSTTADLARIDIFNSTNFGGTCSTTGGTTITVPDGVPALFWRLTFYVDGVSATAASVGIQGAPNNGGVAGTWTTTGFSIIEGANPISSAAQGTMVVRGYFKFIRIFCSGVTGSLGTITATIEGYKGTSPAVSAGGGAASNVNVQQYGGNAVASAGLNGLFAVGGAAGDGVASAGNPVLIGGHDSAGTPLAHIIQTDTFGGILPSGVTAPFADGISNTETVPSMAQAGAPVASTTRDFPMKFNGSTWDRDFIATNSVQVALSGTAYTQIIAGSNVLRIWKVFVTSVSGGNPSVNTFNIAFGTCASTPTQIFTAGGVTGFDEDFGGALRSGSGQALCIKESVANSDLVTVTYTTGY